MRQLTLDILDTATPATPAEDDITPLQAHTPQLAGTEPLAWAPVEAPPPEVGARIIDRGGRLATVTAVRLDPGINESIDITLDTADEGGPLVGLFAPTWWHDWRTT